MPVTQELDGIILQWFNKPTDNKKRSQAKSYVKKYFEFCAASHVTPLPLTLLQLMRFATWLPRHGNINSGWKGVKNYTGAVVKYNQALGQPDPRTAEPEFWDLLRTRFKNEVQIVKTIPEKLPIRQSMVTALAVQAIDTNTPEATEDMACDSLLNFSAVRVGHVSPENSQDLRHVLAWQDQIFLPSIEDCKFVFYKIDSTKSRQITEVKPWWTAVGIVTSNPAVCPVRWAVEHYRANYAGDPTAPIFTNRKTGKPLTRSLYQSRMQDRLARAITAYLPDLTVDIRQFTGISWRKGGITALSSQAALNSLHMNQVADFADHKDIKTSRNYISDSIATRAGYSDMIAQAGNGIDLAELFTFDI